MTDCNEIKSDVTTDIVLFLVIFISPALMHLSTDFSHTCSNVSSFMLHIHGLFF